MNLKMFLLVCLLLCSMAQVAADDNTDPFARDLLILSDWFEGEFDNEEQLWFENDRRTDIAEADRHERIHTTHVRLDLPEFGEHVFYVEEYKDNDASTLIRQRFVTFRSDSKSGAIRMQQGFFKKAEKFAGAQNDLSVFNKLKQKDVFFMDECDVYWNRVADQFEGQMRSKACVFGEGEKRRYSVHNLVLSQSKYWRVDSTFLVSDDSLYVGGSVDAPYEMRRAKPFLCQVVFNNDQGSQKLNDLRLHSQGGTIDVKRDSDGAEFTILLRDKEYPFYSTRPDFMFLSIREKGAERSLAYSVNDPMSRSFGIKMSELLVYCYLEGYEFRELHSTLF